MSTSRGARLWVVGGVLLAVLLTVATYLLVISPARSEVASVQSQVDDAALQQTVLRHRLRDLEKVAADSGGLQAQLAVIATALPAEVDTQGLLRQVQQLATASGTVTENVTFGEAEASGVENVWAVPVSVSVVGGTTGLVDFLTRWQTENLRLVTVGTSSVKQEGSTFRLTLGAQVYTSAPPTASTAGTVTGGAAGTVTGGAAGGAAAPGAAAGGAAGETGSATPS